MPRPLTAAPTVPATCVPCPFSSTSAGSEHDPSGSSAQGVGTSSIGISHVLDGSSSHCPSTDGMSVVKLRLRAWLKFGAMSGWEASMPVSRIPTRTLLFPASTACDPCLVAPIIGMSHWRGAKVSNSPLPATSPPDAVRSPRRVEALRSASRRSSENFWRFCCPTLPTGRLLAAPNSAGCATAFMTKSSWAEVTVARPIARFSLRIVPPRRFTAARASPSVAPRS